MKLILAILANILARVISQEEEGPTTVTVRTTLGNITGTTHGDHARFLGIPFAQPPIGPRRFMPPVPVTKYTDLQATEFGSECTQTNFYGETAGQVIGDENCLFLNVFTPEVPNGRLASVSLKPVMVWIYGGAFTQGSSNEYSIPLDLLKEDVVVVTFNYRVGVFGFLSFGNDLVSGNQGIRDQILALKWVQEHIHNFGGDKSRVTIFGESAGGVSVHVLQLSPLAAGLFSAAIAQSGNLMVIQSKSQDWRTAQSYAETFNCNSLDYSGSMLKCLQDIEPVTLQTTTMILDYNIDETDPKYSWASPWPVQDYYSSDPVLPLDPLQAMHAGQFNKVPIMTGVVQYEGALSLGYAQAAENQEKWWRDLGPFFLQMTQSSNRSELEDFERSMADAILQFYAQGSVDSITNQDGWQVMFQDTGFLSPDQKFVELSSKHVDVYNYFYTHHSNHSFVADYGYEDNKWSPIHADEILFLFNFTNYLNKNPKTEEDDLMTRIMTKYWTNFAKFGTPSPQKIQTDEVSSNSTSLEVEVTTTQAAEEEELDLPEWKPVSTEKEYMNLSTSPYMASDNAPTRMFFMQKIYWDKRENELQRTQLLEEVSKSILTFIN